MGILTSERLCFNHHAFQMPNLMHKLLLSVVPENIHTPSTEWIKNSLGVGSSQKPKKLSKCTKLDWNE